ncbi:hypothetical protein [Vibrio parahaemolyticus]|uniref:hypothetical protein n=1 Tax=Vibrio parahaemolyticus TaxID=670 RepID=UPI0017842519|nr:hypothetical protein [Vibrio parahaemolyticus]MBD6945043.1 hypothetical protein [Vibrio parahaemolyticus]MBD6978940.1 hypothetical protein [Vibrio parahaemolyticus]MBD6990945.1 hypothetical protein [Vibrio parahaemolyticus]MCG6459656.1 hypothetical protein [Vibrio parahaemolyticus]WOZ62906.1 hypothetical protein RHS38_26175 [Vibrio parahaemolyticus]
MALIEYDFAIVAASSVNIDHKSICELADRLFDVGAEDCTLSSRGNALIIEFDREAESYEQAVMSAIKQVNLIESLTVIRVGVD